MAQNGQKVSLRKMAEEALAEREVELVSSAVSYFKEIWGLPPETAKYEEGRVVLTYEDMRFVYVKCESYETLNYNPEGTNKLITVKTLSDLGKVLRTEDKRRRNK